MSNLVVKKKKKKVMLCTIRITLFFFFNLEWVFEGIQITLESTRNAAFFFSFEYF